MITNELMVNILNGLLSIKDCNSRCKEAIAVLESTYKENLTKEWNDLDDKTKF